MCSTGHPLSSKALVQPMPAYSKAVTAEIKRAGGINPPVYRALVQTMRYAALFRHARADSLSREDRRATCEPTGGFLRPEAPAARSTLAKPAAAVTRIIRLTGGCLLQTKSLRL